MELQPYPVPFIGLPSAPSQRSSSGLQNLNIALLIDFDNVILGVEDPGFDVELVVDALRERGIVVMGRAYGDWYRHNRHRRKLMEQGIELVETPVFGPLIKNSADIRIVLDAFEIAMTQQHIDAFCLVSGDSDFLPLIKKLQYLGKHVIVIAGNKFTSDLVRRNCNEFVSYENLYAEATGTEDPSTLEGAFALLQRALHALAERRSDTRSSGVKQMMVQLNPAFSERTFGYAQFRGFLDRASRAGIIKLGARDGASGEYVVYLPDADLNGAVPESKAAPRTRTATPTTPAVAASAVGTTSATPEATAETATEEAGATNGRRRRRRRRPNGTIETIDGDETSVTEGEGAEADLEESEATNEMSSEPTESEAPARVEASASRHETMNNTGQNLLMGRNVRRGRLRFTARSGRAEAIPSTSAAPVGDDDGMQAITGNDGRDPLAVGVESGDAVASAIAASEQKDANVPDALALTTEATPPAEAMPSPEAPSAPKPASRRRTGRRSGSTSETKATDAATEPTPTAAENDTATPEADSEATTTRRPTRRRRQINAVAEHSLPETAPATEAEAARNEADADSMGITFPGATYQIDSTDDTPSSRAAPIGGPGRRAAAGSKRPSQLVTTEEPEAGQIQRVDDTGNPPLADAVAADVVAVGQAVSEEGNGAAEGNGSARKPRRGRRGGTRRRTTSSGNEAGEGTGGDQSAAGAGESAGTGDDAASPTTSN